MVSSHGRRGSAGRAIQRATPSFNYLASEHVLGPEDKFVRIKSCPYENRSKYLSLITPLGHAASVQLCFVTETHADALRYIPTASSSPGVFTQWAAAYSDAADRQPNVREAVFLATWTVQHVIDVNPGGVAEPIRVAVIEQDPGAARRHRIRELPDVEMEESRQAIDSAGNALRDWLLKLQRGEAIDDVPPPPNPPAVPAP